MVNKAGSVYLFVGQDSIDQNGVSQKALALSRIKEQFSSKGIADFNVDTLYSREVTLKVLKERVLSLPVKAHQRILVIRELENAKEDVKQFLLDCVKKAHPALVLVFDVERHDPQDQFLRALSRFCRVISFKSAVHVDTFTLSQHIDRRNTEHALRTLHQLLQNGERPERILGGLRYACERNVRVPQETRRRIALLLACDKQIKTGKVKPAFALERLVVGLCGLFKP